MANDEHVRILKKGVRAWNEWRTKHAEIEPDFRNADLTSMDFSVQYETASEVTHFVNYIGADLREARLSGADLSKTKLRNVDFRGADLSGANLSGTSLWFASFNDTLLRDADLSGSSTLHTNFLNTDLSTARGLDSIVHLAASNVDINTLYRSVGKISKEFLRGCGVPEDFIAFIPSHFDLKQAIQFYSCFISYSTRDEEFARRLYSRMRDENLRVWFAPEDIKGGEKLYEQVERAIQLHDRLLLVISEHSIQSEWVMTEIRKARKVEVEKKRRKLFPIRLVDFETIKQWVCFDADTSKDIAVEVREYFIPDFSNWKDHDSFEASFERLLHDLMAEEMRAGPA